MTLYKINNYYLEINSIEFTQWILFGTGPSGLY
jgi:hypothetical protein